MAWLVPHIQGPLAIPFFIAEFGMYTLIPLHCYNHWRRRYELIGGTYSLRVPVDVFIPTVDESLDILRQSIQAAVAINYPSLKVYVLDDGNRPEVKKLAQQYGAEYLARPDQNNKRYKAANLNYGLVHSFGAFILTIDADNIVRPEILDDLLGHFSNKKVAFVASRQTFTTEEADFNHDHMFFEHIQAGKNADDAAISCGSGVIYRRSALEEINGFAEWSLVEDLYTSYQLNAAGWQSVYSSQAYVLGFAPSDLAAVYKQRRTWGIDTLRMFFWDNPLAKHGLSVRQRWHYFEIGWSYIVSGLFLPSIFLLNIICLLGERPIVTGGLWYIALRLPALMTSMWMFGRVARGQTTSRIWAGLFPVYFISIILALRYRTTKPRYHVTQKHSKGNRDIRHIVPQLAFALCSTAAALYNLSAYDDSLLFSISFFWVIVMWYWLLPIMRKGFFPETATNQQQGVVWPKLS